MRISAHAAATHAGRKRRLNEDSYVERPPLFAIADGMGGARAGEVASRLAAAALEDDGVAEGAPEERVVELIQEANRRVFERAHEDASVSGMGTTMTVAIVDDGGVTIGHVGDSRAYRLRHGDLEQLTDDHSLVAELVRSGRLTPEEADAHPQRSVITRAVGTDPDVDVDAFTVAAEPGDVYLLCSDGLTDMLNDGGIRTVFEEHPDDLQATAKGLVSAANRVGGDDNITVVCFAMDEDAPEGATAVGDSMEAIDGPTEENALDDTLDGLDAPTALEEPGKPDEPRRGMFAPALLVAAVLAIVVLVFLVLR
jgi:serine/threonine protein phosphatase PrpC